MITVADPSAPAAGLARWRPAGAGGRAVAAALAAAVAAGGCSTVPTSGPVQQVGAGQVGISQEQNSAADPGAAPGPGWTATQIVSGFLAASASFAGDHAVAREYLDSTAQRNWKPGWAVTVVSTTLRTSNAPAIRRQVSGQSRELAQVKVTGLPVATLTGTGQYLASSGSSSESYHFSLVKINGQWRIDTPAHVAAAADRDRLRAGVPAAGPLLPHPVGPDAGARPGVRAAAGHDHRTGHRAGQRAAGGSATGWLAGAAVTGFPAQGLAHRRPGRHQRLERHRQPGRKARHQPAGGSWSRWPRSWPGRWPAGRRRSSRSSFRSTGARCRSLGNQYQLPQAFHGWVPPQPAGSSLYFVGSHGVGPGTVRYRPAGLRARRRGSRRGRQVRQGRAPALSSIAVSPDRRWVAGITAGGAAVYIGDLSRGAWLRVAAHQRQLHLGELGRAGRSLDRRRRRGLDAAAGRQLRGPGHHGRRGSRGAR